jgi:tetratricopeptide (TPR) repeat protein/ADP-heptose:LPS heptosyltransferase
VGDILKDAVALHRAGKLEEAARLYRDVLAVQPDQPDTLALLSGVLTAQGAYDEAIALIEKAVARDPDAALFRLHHGNALMQAKRMDEAASAFRAAIKLKPDLAEAHYNLANVLRAANNWTGAIDAYTRAIAVNPNYAEAHNNLALSYVHEKRYDEAFKEAEKATTLAPDYGEGWVTVCNVAEKVNDYKTGLAAGEKAIALLPGNHFAWFGYGIILNRLDRHEEAVAAYKRALELKPGREDIWDNLGQTHQSLNRLEDAEAAFRKTIEVAGQVIAGEGARAIAEDEYGHRHWHLALLELLRGKYKEGFARYRSRFKKVGGLQRPSYSRPLWKGEDLTGKTILITDEQGMGDTLMLARYLPHLKQRGAKIIFSVHPALEPLFKGWPGADTIIVHGATVSAYDCYASVFDLPYIFGTTLATIPAQVPYLPQLPPDDKTLIKGDRRPKVGVVWGGNPLHTNDQRRSIPLAIFAAIFSEKNVQFFSFNRDMKEGDAVLLPNYPVIDLTKGLNNFADAARLVGQMDLVITCDTATAHLAGGLGKSVWVLLPFAPDWRWLLDRSDSVWYPSARLFRQPRIGDWAGVMANVTEALCEKFPVK